MHNDKILNKLLDIFSDDHLGLLEVKPQSPSARNENERLVSTFQEILEFYSKNNREPKQGGDIQETALYFRLKGIRENEEKKLFLALYDSHNLLRGEEIAVESIDDILNSDILGILDNDADDILILKHVSKETTMPDYIGRRKPCKDFVKFEHLFIDCQQDIITGKRKLLPFRNEQQIDKGYFFVLKGIKLYVAEIGKREIENGKVNARLRCIFENGMESDMLLRSLAAELYKDGRRITEHDDKLLDGFNNITADDEETGFIYVLKSKSTDPKIKAIKNLYKIGFSAVSVEERIKNAEKEATYLMAPVSVVTAFKCYNMDPHKMELLLHNFFGSSCLDVFVYDSNGKKCRPREWFIAPYDIILQAIHFVMNGEIVDYKYDTAKQLIVGR